MPESGFGVGQLNLGNASLNTRLYLLAAWILATSALFLDSLVAFVRLCLAQDDASYLLVIPFLSVGVVFLERHQIFANLSTEKFGGAGFLLAGSLAAIASHLFAPERLPLSILSLILLGITGFTFLFGKSSFKASSFALLFLFLMIPPPNSLLDRVVYLLQTSSAWLTQAFFDLAGVPVLREGMVFHLAGVNIEVAKECSGIRSSMAMLILSLLVVHFYLRSFWKKVTFVASAIFMMILKNGVRIASLTLLSIYIDPSFLYGRIHHEGGAIFFLLGLLLLTPLLWFLRRGEGFARSRALSGPTPSIGDPSAL